MKDDPRLHAESAAEFGDWLAANHATMTGVWLVTWRTVTGRPAPSYEDAVTEAPRFGWVDSTARKLDDGRGGPRRRQLEPAQLGRSAGGPRRSARRARCASSRAIRSLFGQTLRSAWPR